MSPRDAHRHTARVLLREARARRDRSPQFAATLLKWAKNQRRLSNECVQRDLFGKVLP